MADVPENFMKYENIKDKVISYVFNMATSKWWFLSFFFVFLFVSQLDVQCITNYMLRSWPVNEDLLEDYNIPVTISI